MNNMKKSIKRVFWLTVGLFLLLIFFLTKTVYWDSSFITTNSYNPRLNYNEGILKRGDIKSIDGSKLATSERLGNKYVRKYVYGETSVTITGYTAMGKTGLEAAENFQLIKLHHEILQRLKNIFTGAELVGNHIVTSIEMKIQQKVVDLLGTQKGAIVVVEPSTGRILAMASSPSFDPNSVAEKWDYLRENESSPLVNRATQGLYPPGSTFKVITALAAIENLSDWQTFTYECKGEADFENKVIHCFDGKAHGTVDMKLALAASCNCYFAEIGKQIGSQKIKDVAERFHFNQNIPFILAQSDSSIALNLNTTESELVETSIGQGKTTVTPLFMAMIAASIANDGIMMQPYLVDHIEYNNGKTGKISIPKKIDTVMTPQEAEIITQMMIEVVNSGTGTPAKVSGIEVAGKTGTAENETGEDHSWFIGFAPAEQPKIAFAIVLENAGGKRSAASVAGKLIKSSLQ